MAVHGFKGVCTSPDMEFQGYECTAFVMENSHGSCQILIQEKVKNYSLSTKKLKHCACQEQRERERTPLCQNKILFKNNEDLFGESKGPGEKGTECRAQGFGLQVLALGRHCRDLSWEARSQRPHRQVSLWFKARVTRNFRGAQLQNVRRTRVFAYKYIPLV